uniref:Uncharacterized protein n=1 Tax=Vitis vinifera TaxID=29760 RepID=A5BFI3_VITVI|nr:hypothetical protein VITISV_024519 [Vitis vinifera]
MAQNSVVEMVIEASDVEGASGGTTRVVGGVVEVASGIGGAGVGGTDFVGSMSRYACLACGGTRVLAWVGLLEVPNSLPTVSICRE